MSNQETIEELLETVEQQAEDIVALQSECDRLHNWMVDATRASNLNVTMAQANFNALLDVMINNKRVIARAFNRHTYSTVPTRELHQPEARRRARDLRSWAKPKGWRV